MRCALWWVGGGGLCENAMCFGLLVGRSLNNNQISDAGAAKIAAALPNSKLTILE